MATNRNIFADRRVALISADTYRVAAVEQLKTFASIARLPMEVVYRPEELPGAITRLMDEDVILIDTAGRSQNDSEALDELGEFLNLADPDEVILVLSAGTRVEDQRETVRKFSKLHPTRMLLTKLDEISSAGHLLELPGMLAKSWTYLTTGQSVPDDILSVEPDILAAAVTRKEYFEELRSVGFRLPAGT